MRSVGNERCGAEKNCIGLAMRRIDARCNGMALKRKAKEEKRGA